MCLWETVTLSPYFLSLPFRCILLSVSSSWSFPDVFCFQENLFFFLNTPYSCLSPAPSTDLFSGISPFLSLLLGWPFLCSTLVVSCFPQHLLGQLVQKEQECALE